MTKQQLIDEIMRRARYSSLDDEQQRVIQSEYRGMTKRELEQLLEHPPATWDQ